MFSWNFLNNLLVKIQFPRYELRRIKSSIICQTLNCLGNWYFNFFFMLLQSKHFECVTCHHSCTFYTSLCVSPLLPQIIYKVKLISKFIYLASMRSWLVLNFTFMFGGILLLIPLWLEQISMSLHPILDTRISMLHAPSRSDHPPWILKQGGLESSGQILSS